MKLSKLNFVFDSLKTKKSQPFILAHQYILTGAKYSSDGSYLTLEDGVTVIDPVAGGFSLRRNHKHGLDYTCWGREHVQEFYIFNHSHRGYRSHFML